MAEPVVVLIATRWTQRPGFSSRAARCHRHEAGTGHSYS